MGNFAGKVAIVTGGSSGIGRAAALALARDGACMGTAEEAAEAIVWLCSDAASFVTGHVLMVDGGYAAQ